MLWRLPYHFGRYLMMLWQAFSIPENFRMYWKETVRQMYDIGIGSLVIVALISIFIGAVSGLQFVYQLDGQLIPMYYIGYIVRDLAIIELSPTFTNLVLSGKVGSNMTSEIGGMRQKEHIDAMEIMGLNTAAYLVLPRTIAALAVIPLLVAVSAILAIAGGYAATVLPGELSHTDYVRGLRTFYNPYNIQMMFIKSYVFAFILSTVSCYQGYYVKSGSVNLGKASTQAVVYSNILILLADYLLVVLLTSD